MKVCPYCSGITEEEHAVKCSICGQTIKDEPDSTKEELDNELIRQEINQKYRALKKKKKFKQLGLILSGVIALIIVIACINIFEPKGHLEFKQLTYETKVGTPLTIEIIYSGNVTAKNIRLKILQTDNPNDISFRYKIDDNLLIITPIKADHLIIQLTVKDDGLQKNYDNEIAITITN